VSTALVATLQPVNALAAPPPAGTAAGKINWQPCEEDKSVDCGTLRVPIDWANPRGSTVDIAVARRKATDSSARVGVLVINPGGPGGSGVNFAIRGNEYFSKEINQKFDLIGFDPRGVARSNPVVCSLDKRPRLDSLPRNQAEFEALVAANRAYGEDCRKHTGPLIDHVDTKSVVRDIDAIRKALGEKRINYFGVSYGTLIGQQYAEKYPKNFRRMVIDSNMDHSLNTRKFFATEAWAAEDAFREFTTWCRQEPRCALHKQGAVKVWDALMAKADRGQLTDPADPNRRISSLELSGMALGAFYGPDWKELAAWLHSLHTGKPAPPAVIKALKQPPARAAGDPELGRHPLAVFCQDWDVKIRDHRQLTRYLEESRRIAPHMRVSTLAWVVSVSCLGWPTAVTNPPRRLKVSGSETILITNPRHDPATGFLWGQNTARQLGSAGRFVIYEGWGHGVYDRSPCTLTVNDRYLVDGVLPAPGTRCPGVLPPMDRSLAKRRIAPAPLPGNPSWIR
jgi:pimeloyl-ACP methyl ester carboxylesterase